MKKLLLILCLISLTACRNNDETLTRIDITTNKAEEIHLFEQPQLDKFESLMSHIEWLPHIENENIPTSDVTISFFYTDNPNMPERIANYTFTFDDNSLVTSSAEDELYGHLNAQYTKELQKLLTSLK